MTMSNSYTAAGVNIEAGNTSVELIKPHAVRTHRAGVMAGLGGFGALFDLKAAGFEDPILVSSTDGVGTKLKIAIEYGQHRTVGIDLVAMCVNDILVQGAQPLFFLDYYGCGKLQPQHVAEVVAGIADGCLEAGCSLVGGETAELPGMYQGSDYDLAGFTVGAVERHKLITGENIRAGDVVLGIESNGVHSNGFSLVRKVVEQAGLDYRQPAPFQAIEPTLGAALLKPTKIYISSVLALCQAGLLKGVAHITGGGLLENIPRILPDDVSVQLDASTWPFLPVFSWLKKAGNLSVEETARTFNCGIGMILIVSPAQAAAVRYALANAGEHVYTIGEVVKKTSDERVVLRNVSEW